MKAVPSLGCPSEGEPAFPLLDGVSSSLPETLTAILRHRAESSPHAPAFVEKGSGGWQPVSFGEFETRARSLARGLCARGIVPGDRVAILGPSSLAWELVHHAALLARAQVVGLDPYESPQRLRSILREARPAALFVKDSSVVEELGQDAIGSARLIVSLEPDGRGLDLPALENADGTGNLPEVSPDDWATVIYTSGTTGLPKGIAYSHRQMVASCAAILDAFSLFQAGTRLVCWMPLSSLFQRLVNLCGIGRGATTWIAEDPFRVMAAVAEAQPDIFIGVPRFYEKLWAGLQAAVAERPLPARMIVRAACFVGARHASRVRSAQPIPPALALLHRMLDRIVLARLRRSMGSRVTYMVSGSAPMPAWLLEDLHSVGWVVLEAYGLSENVIPIAANRPDLYRFGSVGRSLEGNAVRIEPDGVVAVKGAGVLSGYIGDQELPNFTADGWLRTGDLGSLDSDGFLHLTGRTSDIIKTSGGRSFAPGVIEAALRRVAFVRDAVVAGAGRKCLIGLLTLEREVERPTLEREVRRALLELAPHERPAALLVLPRPFSTKTGEVTCNLKIRRQLVEEKYASLFNSVYRALDQPNSSFPLFLFVSDAEPSAAESEEFPTFSDVAGDGNGAPPGVPDTGTLSSSQLLSE